MPEINADNMSRIAFHVPLPLLDEAREMCELEGWKFSEFHRMCWEAGLSIQAEKSNKRLVNKGLRAKEKKRVEGDPQAFNDAIIVEKMKDVLMRAKSGIAEEEKSDPQ